MSLTRKSEVGTAARMAVSLLLYEISPEKAALAKRVDAITTIVPQNRTPFGQD
jgi:hypothetical protein